MTSTGLFKIEQMSAYLGATAMPRPTEHGMSHSDRVAHINAEISNHGTTLNSRLGLRICAKFGLVAKDVREFCGIDDRTGPRYDFGAHGVPVCQLGERKR